MRWAFMASTGCGWQEADRFCGGAEGFEFTALLALKNHPSVAGDAAEEVGGIWCGPLFNSCYVTE